MATTLANNNSNDQINTTLFDPQLFTAPDLEDETTIIKPPETPTPIRPSSTISTTISSLNRKNQSKTRSYKFIQLERALTAANLLKNNDDRVQFENEYLHSIRRNTFEQFLEKFYQKIRDHYEQIKQEQAVKKARMFTFFDLESKFLALDPTRDVKIIFIDERSTRAKSAHQRTNSAAIASEAAIESFYAKRSQILLNNPSRARDEVTLFARRTAERLQDNLPRLNSVPYRVKIVDERDTTGQPDERALRQMKHKRALSLINQRRHVVFKMLNQTKKNQIKMDEQWNQPSFGIDSSACCRELLERANQIEHVTREEERSRPRPQTAIISRRRSKQAMSSFSDSTTTNTNIIPSFITNATPFRDALSVDQMEKTKNIRVLLPTRPATAPTKVNWINYC